MYSVLLVMDLHLEGCQSLKDKRQRLKGFADRWGKVTQVAVCESDYQDALQKAQWSFIVAGSNGPQVQQLLARLEEDFLASVDALITHRHQERLL